MDNILEFDLNELVSKQVSDKIESLEAQLKSQSKTLQEYRTKIDNLNKVNKKFETATSLLDILRERFKSITGKPETRDTFKTTFRQEKYSFAATILKDLFGITPLTDRTFDVGFAIQLAVNYYDQREAVCHVLEYILEEPSNDIATIKQFVMPYDWTKAQVVKWINGSKHNTNGCHKGISTYWLESGGKESNAPHDLILKNKCFLEDDVFEEVAKNLTPDRGFEYLLSLPQYTNLSQEKLERMGECLLLLRESHFKYEEVRQFIKSYLKKFNEKTVEFLYKKVRSDNQFNTFHWENFPQAYQEKFLMEKSFNEVFKIVGNYSCEWTETQKRDFLQKYLSEKTVPEPEAEDSTDSLTPSRKKS